MAVDERRVVFTRDRASELSGLSNRQLDYWRQTLLLEPSESHQVSRYRSVHFYSFADMLELLTIAALRSNKVPTRRVRRIVNRLREQGYDRPLTQIKYGVAAKSDSDKVLVFITYPDGTVEGDDHPGQLVEEGSVDMAEIRARLLSSAERPPAAVGHTERRRGRLGSKEVVAGTRIPVATVRSYLDDGADTAEVLEAFPVLRREDVEALRVSA